jgi:sugar phosphate isomerase/epimerase
MWTRRALLATPLLAAPFKQPIGINLYTVRNSLAKAPGPTYEALARLGITTLEVRPVQILQHASFIRAAGLKPVHMFIETPIVTGAWDEWAGFSKAMAARMKMPAPPANPNRPTLDEMIALAKTHGIQRIGTSMLLPGERATAIEAINRAADTCAKQGIELYYHNHAFEFDGNKGQRFIDRLHKELSPKVRFEMDIFWVSITGNSPLELLDKWKGRVRSIHLKDLAPNVTRPAQETDVAPTAFRELGQGTLPLPKILKAAKKAGVEHFLIELDFSPGDPLDSVRKCCDYLKSVSV